MLKSELMTEGSGWTDALPRFRSQDLIFTFDW